MTETSRRSIPFTKMEGAGNDYVYINDLDGTIPNLSELAIEMSRPHFGVGSDGLIALQPSSEADFKMRMFNADGSEGRMCGNGIRCLAAFAYENSLTDKTNLTIETLSGVKTVQLMMNSTDNIIAARVDMGKPILNTQLIPINTSATQWLNQDFVVNDETYQVTAVSMGNPHLVIYQEGIDELDLPEVGPFFENHPLFPEKMNTEFVEVISPNEVRMRVWERGSGETLACGTGACAVAVASVLNGLTATKVVVHLKGGQLNIEWDRENTGNVFMEGAVRTIFTGEYFSQNS
ncbi:diaminopimelate epimerase [Fundicoccus culcitae]|uniref:Diaminopimelate epimerase n=1 Tax=Fundicoccus culcitae TaxID=2969821 RepID=A0ABY5P8X7_9LACT|nr:diaminopimelate epimerase [Fundicoccus culcitae]UUX35041.1 diaminopimelate epimerase [Fundicoccus culcitae]